MIIAASDIDVPALLGNAAAIAYTGSENVNRLAQKHPRFWAEPFMFSGRYTY